MGRGPLVSILMPVYNAEATLPAALESVRRQTFVEWEFVIVDDGSDDRTPALLEAAARRDSRLRVFREAHVGLVEALRTAARRASGELLARMDADDVMHPRRLLLQVSRMDSPPAVDVLAARVRCMGRTGEGMRRYVEWQNRLLTHEEIVGNLFVESPIAHPSVMMRRSLFERAGGYRDPGWAEDYDLWHRLRERGARFEKLPRSLLSWRDHERRASRTHPLYAEKRFHEARVHYFLRHPLAGGPVTVWGAGPIGRSWARDLLRAGVTVERAIDIDPRKIGRAVAGGRVEVVSPEEGLRRRGGLVLGAVGSRGARELIKTRLLESGLAEGRDFLFVA
jgi:glycosyltransferase involved in cell wall biosynthesis